MTYFLPVGQGPRPCAEAIFHYIVLLYLPTLGGRAVTGTTVTTCNQVHCVWLLLARAAFNRLRLRPRVLRGMSVVDTTITVLGARLKGPICVAPTGGLAQNLMW